MGKTLAIMQRAWGISAADAQDLLFPVARRTWLAAVDADGLQPVNPDEPCKVELVGTPPTASILASGEVRNP